MSFGVSGHLGTGASRTRLKSLDRVGKKFEVVEVAAVLDHGPRPRIGTQASAPRFQSSRRSEWLRKRQRRLVGAAAVANKGAYASWTKTDSGAEGCGNAAKAAAAAPSGRPLFGLTAAGSPRHESGSETAARPTRWVTSGRPAASTTTSTAARYWSTPQGATRVTWLLSM